MYSKSHVSSDLKKQYLQKSMLKWNKKKKKKRKQNKDKKLIIIINSYTFVTLIKSIHEKNLCYVYQVNKTLWDRKSLVIYVTVTCSWNNKAETMYQICSQWSHVKKWVLLSLWTALKALFSSSFLLLSWNSSWLQ